MLITKDSPVGIDTYIDALQKHLYSNLSSKWIDDQWICYPRCYKNKRKDRESGSEYFVPEYAKTIIDYQDVLFDDKVNVLSFFIKGDDISINDFKRPVSKVSLIISTKINDLYPTVVHRADEELKQDVFDLVVDFGQGWELKGMFDGIDNVYSEFKRDGVILSDIAPRHVVRFDFELTYKLKCNCC